MSAGLQLETGVLGNTAPVGPANPIPVTGGTPSSASTSAVATVRTTAAAGSQVVKASPGNLYGFSVVAGASAGYVLIYDSTTVPADGATQPVVALPVAANAGLQFDFPTPRRFNTGIVMVFSTTGPFTKTISATAFLSGAFV